MLLQVTFGSMREENSRKQWRREEEEEEEEGVERKQKGKVGLSLWKQAFILFFQLSFSFT